jgi:hypothetical protein
MLPHSSIDNISPSLYFTLQGLMTKALFALEAWTSLNQEAAQRLPFDVPEDMAARTLEVRHWSFKGTLLSSKFSGCMVLMPTRLLAV